MSNGPSRSNFFPSGYGRFIGRSSRDTGVLDEYVSEINGSTSFATTGWVFNPGNPLTFPRFNTEAALYEKLLCISAEFYFKPEVSAFNAQGSGGKVMLSFDYDASDPPPTTKVQVEDSDPHSDGMPYETLRLRLDPAFLNDGPHGKYVLNSAFGYPANVDPKTYLGGTLYVSTTGTATTNVIGELRVRCHFRLMKPVFMGSRIPKNYLTALFQNLPSSPQSLVSNTTTIQNLTQAILNPVGMYDAVGTIILPAGNYFVQASVIFVSSANVLSYETISLYQDGVPLVWNTTNAQSSTAGTGIVTLHGNWFVSSNGNSQIQLNALAVFASGTCSTINQLFIKTC